MLRSLQTANRIVAAGLQVKQKQIAKKDLASWGEKLGP
jgi:hypothetical protein